MWKAFAQPLHDHALEARILLHDLLEVGRKLPYNRIIIYLFRLLVNPVLVVVDQARHRSFHLHVNCFEVFLILQINCEIVVNAALLLTKIDL